MMPDSEARSELVLELAEEFLERYRKGERPPLREYIDRHPELAAEIKEVFPAMAMMENIAVADESMGDSAVKAPQSPEVNLTQLGDYRIIREIGRGGMGVVYEAEQVSLGRHVALKLLPNQALRDVKHKRRFEREARAAAKLHHTNIVPVFGVGDHDGVPYYVMQFIQGLGLDVVLNELNRLQPGTAPTPNGMPTAGEIRVARRDVTAVDVARSLMTGAFQQSSNHDDVGDPNLRPALDVTADHRAPPSSIPSMPSSGSGRLSDSFAVASSSITLPGSSATGRKSAGRKQTYWQSVANIGRQVAEALEYAHKQGIQHRDVKPSNLLLDLHGTVWVTDFGLAKVVGAGAEDITHTGDLLGTLRYMPPEAFEGKTDARGDVYSLGLTLYELLAMRPAFGEKDRNKLIKQVTTGEPTPLEKARRDVPRDLVTIIQKAIAREPSRRYATAEELATDLQRFLDDEPIQARRQTQIERCVRWARHNPGIAMLGGALTAVLVLATSASLIVAGRMSYLAQKETQAAANERMARQLAVEAREREAGERKRADKEAEIAQQNFYYSQMHLGQQAWREHRGLPQLRELLSNWLPKGGSADRRGWEWFYLNSLPHQNLRTLMESDGSGKPQPCIVALHAASKRLASGTGDGLIRIWDIDDEQVNLILRGPGSAGSTHWEARWFAWSPDGGKLAAGFHDGTLHVWETISGRELGVFGRRESPIMAVTYSSDGLRLAAWSENGAIKIWDVDTGRLNTDVVHSGSVTVGAWSPDDKLLASGHEDGTVTISGTNAGDKIVTLRGHISQIHALAWSPDGTRLASTSFDFTARIWEVASGKMVLGPLRHSHEITSVEWEPNGKRLATGSIDETVKIWDATTGREELTLRGHVSNIVSLAWTPDGRLASGGHDGSIKVWTAIRDQESSVLPGRVVRATTVAWSPNGKLLASGGDDGKVRIWDPATREEVRSIKAHDENRISQQFGLILTLAWSPDGTHLASGGLDGTAKVWEVASGREVFALPEDHGLVWSVAWSPDGTRLAVGAQDGTIQIIEGITQTPKIHAFNSKQGRVRGLAWSPNGDRLASAGADKLVKIWDPTQGIELASLPGHQAPVFRISWSPDGKRLASGGADFRIVILWDAQTGQKLSTMRGHNDWVEAVVWSPDGTRLASAGTDNTVRIWDSSTGEETFQLRGIAGFFHDVSWHPDGAQLAAASSDGHIWIWDATPGFEHDRTPRALPYIERKFTSKPANNAERIHFAQLAYEHKKFTIAARLWAEALASDPKLVDDIRAQHFYKAARAACMAADGRSKEEPPLDDVAKAKLHGQALDWLKEELNACGRLLESRPPQDRELILFELSSWKHDPNFAGIRDTAALAKLPVEGQKEFTQLWADVAALLTAGNAQHGAFLQEGLPNARKTLPKDGPELAYLLAQIGRTLLEQEQWAAAEPVLRECLAIREKTEPDDWKTFNTFSSLGGSLLGQKKYAEAEPLLLKGYDGMKRLEKSIPLFAKDRLFEAVERLVQLNEAIDKKDQTDKWRAELQKFQTWANP
jgi:eukaryotic-like serine/threonine-protein kinase